MLIKIGSQIEIEGMHLLELELGISELDLEGESLLIPLIGFRIQYKFRTCLYILIFFQYIKFVDITSLVYSDIIAALLSMIASFNENSDGWIPRSRWLGQLELYLLQLEPTWKLMGLSACWGSAKREHSCRLGCLSGYYF